MSAFDLTLNQITHFQKKLIKYASTGETEKVLGCIHKLKYLPVTVSHLEKTGVGKSINALRHRNGIIGEKARALVNKWKTMVDEEEQEEQVDESKHKLPQEELPSYTHTSVPTYVEEEEYDPSDEGGRLQIQEEQLGCEEANRHYTYNPGGNSIEDVPDDNAVDAYNPQTSREDYVSIGDSTPAPYNPSSSVDYSNPGKSSLPNGVTHSHKDRKVTPQEKHPKSEGEGRHRKKHKSKEVHREKDKSRDSTSSSSQHKKSKHKDKEREKVKDKHKSPHSSDLQECKVSSTTSSRTEKPNHQKEQREEKPEEAKSHKSPDRESSHSRDKRKSHTPSNQKQSHKSSRSSNNESTSSKKRRKDPPAAMLSLGFEAALMGVDSSASKKKKKKSKDKEANHFSTTEYIPSSISNLTIDIHLATQSSKSRAPYDLLNESEREHLPTLPSSFEDEMVTPQLMANYKPLPQVPQRHPLRDPFNQSNEEALNYMLSSKNNKQRRIYAGKSSGLSHVPSLFDLCIRILQENIDALEATGGIPFDLLRPVLDKATPQQLYTLEDYNAYLLEDTDVLWASHCKKHFKNKQRQDLETWREMFFRCTDEQHARMRSVTESLQKKYVTKAQPKRTTQLAYVNTSAKPPKSVARAQAKYGTASSSIQVFKPSKSDDGQKSVGASGAAVPPRPDRPFPNKQAPMKRNKVAPLMGKARQLLKKVCRR